MWNSNCSDVVNASPSEMFNSLVAKIYEEQENEPMTNEQWEEANERAESLYEASIGPFDSDEMFAIVEEFYLET